MTPKKRQYAKPRLEVAIDEEARANAIQSNSGGCLISDAIKRQYPHLSRVTSDMATIRATDRSRGERYIWLTPPTAQHVLLAFDQGWPNPVETVTLARPVQVVPVTDSPKKAPDTCRKASGHHCNVGIEAGTWRDTDHHGTQAPDACAEHGESRCCYARAPVY